jgi:molybdopterin-guanine dinucleotide biosynthesis protein A
VLAAQDPSGLIYHVEFDRSGPVQLADRSVVAVPFHVRRLSDQQPAHDIRADQIVVTEDGRRIRDITIEVPDLETPLNVVLALDGSLGEATARSVNALLSRLREGAACGTILYDHRIRHQEPLRPVRKIPTIRAAGLYGGTAWLDAVAEAVAMLADAPGKKVVIVLTSAADARSRKKLEDIAAAAKDGAITVFTLGFGEPQNREPASLILALDVPLDHQAALKSAATAFIESLAPATALMILPVGARIPTPSFATNHEPLRQMLAQLLAGRAKAPYDALHRAVAMLEASRLPGKRFVVLATDGIDLSSRHRPEEIITEARAAHVELHILGLGPEAVTQQAMLRSLAEETGGSYQHIADWEALPPACADLAARLHHQGIDERGMRILAEQTGGKYYAIRTATQAAEVWPQLAEEIQGTYRVTFRSRRPSHDGTARGIDIYIVRNGVAVSAMQPSGISTRGRLVPELHPRLFLALLAVLGGLLILPGRLRRAWSFWQ